MYCIKCGSEIAKQNKFCSKCGAKVILEEKSKTNQKVSQKKVSKKKSVKKVFILLGVIIGLVLITGTMYYIKGSKAVETSAEYVEYIEELQVQNHIESIIEIEDKIKELDATDEDYISEIEDILKDHKEEIDILGKKITGLKIKDEVIKGVNDTLIQWCDNKIVINKKSSTLLEMTKALEDLESDEELEEAYSGIIELSLEVENMEREAEQLLNKWEANK